MSALESDVKGLKDLGQKTAEGLEVLTKNFNGLIDRMKKTPANGHPSQSDTFGLPNAIIGETGYRGFSFMKMLGLISGSVSPEKAKTECDVHQRLTNAYVNNNGGEFYSWGAKGGQPGAVGGKFLAPLSTAFMHDEFVPGSFRREMKSLVNAGMEGADPDEMSWIKKKMLIQQFGSKALSWLNEFTGGALVAPPEMGELIELLRNKEALVNAGARVVPLPPQGRLKYPRQTAASLTFWVGENAPITGSDLGTGEVTLQAKKLAVLIRAPNELIRFASPAAEALIRDDMTKSLALGLDLAGLEAAGSDTRPRGVLQFPGINRVSSSAPGTDGDKIAGVDLYRCIAAVEESNAEFEGWIMRPKTLYKYFQLRADAVGQGDQQGPFLFNLIREAGDNAPATLAGYPVTKSTQVGQNRTKGAASNLTYVLGGMWSDLLIGMFGAIEFAATTLGDTPFVNDQTWIRGILSADIAARHEAAFVLLDQLDTTI